MIYPEFIKPEDTIGVTACSDGKPTAIDAVRLDNAQRQLNQRGFFVKETPNCRTSNQLRSSDALTRKNQLMELYLDPQVKAIVMASGGEFLVEMLPYLDYAELKKHPKWLQGFSDPTGLLYTVTVNCDIATAYASNFGDFGMKVWHKSIEDNLGLLQGKKIEQQSFDLYESDYIEKKTGLEEYAVSQPVLWKNGRGQRRIDMEGRMLGGCLDVLLNLVGTKYDQTLHFIEKYREDKIIWYLESFSLTSESLVTGLWNLREAGWFDTAAGFIFGRPCFYESSSETPYEEAVMSVLGILDVPIIYDACFGHRAPRMTIINGSFGKISSEHGKGSLIQEFC